MYDKVHRFIMSKQLTLKTIFINSIVSFITIFIKNQALFQSDITEFFSEYFIAPLLIFLADVLFIQEQFCVEQKLKTLQWNSFVDRLKYTFKINIFYKFAVTVFLVSVINNLTFKYIISKMKTKKVINKKNIREINLIVGVLVNIFTTIVFANALKFKWAYVNNSNIILNMLIISWFSITLLITTQNSKASF
jgi:hypothetical protein|tara:strand:+ start:51679 stop:52254 length:576 start_codon:yes stop_codon:yes gene_type:complete